MRSTLIQKRVSRLLLVTDDGSPRFYRELSFLQAQQGGRVLICRLEFIGNNHYYTQMPRTGKEME